MIRSFADKKTERIWGGERSRKLPPDTQNRALAKLRMLNRAKTLDDLRNPPSNRLHALKDDRAGEHSISINKQWRICFVWRDGGADGVEITDCDYPDWLHNAHAGELLVSEFMEPLGLDAATLATAVGACAEDIEAVIGGERPMDAELDLRLARYFRMSEGFFLGLQADYELLEAKRALNGRLDRIVPRAA